MKIFMQIMYCKISALGQCLVNSYNKLKYIKISQCRKSKYIKISQHYWSIYVEINLSSTSKCT